MRFLILLLCFFTSIIQADIFKGQKDEGYFYPEFQAWRVVEASFLPNTKVATDVRAVPLILLNSLVYVAPNYFTLKSVNSGGDMVFPTCFVQNRKNTQAHILSDNGKEFLGESVEFKSAKKGIVYVSLYNSIQLGLKQETELDVGQREKFDSLLLKLQEEKLGYLKRNVAAFKERNANNPAEIAKHQPLIDKTLNSLLQQRTCRFISPPNQIENQPKPLTVKFPQLKTQVVIADGMMNLHQHQNPMSSNTSQRLPRSIEYTRINKCLSTVFFSQYSTMTNSEGEPSIVIGQRQSFNNTTTSGVITKGFLGGLDSSIALKNIMESKQYKDWFKTYYDLRAYGLKVEGLHLSDMFTKVAGASCHREQYRKKFSFNQIVSMFDGLNGFMLEGKLLDDYPSKWETNDLLVLTAPDYKIKIYDSGRDELTAFLEYPLVKD